MSCSVFSPFDCVDAVVQGISEKVVEVAGDVAQSMLDVILAGITDQLHAGIKAMSITLAGWILVPSTQVCSQTGPDWVAACASGGSAAAQVRSWMLPVTALVAVLGIVWQGITMTITRKGEPLLIVLKGLFATAVWGVVGIAGAQLALRAGDAYSYWILQQAIFGNSLSPVEDVGNAIASMSIGESSIALLVLILLQIPFFLVTVIQIILMIFRNGAVIVLAGQLQLAAAGGFSRLTSGWLGRVTGWMLALIAYKPIAASIYAVAFALMGNGVRNLVMGLAVMVLALIAMPALMKFFNWSVGAVASNSNSVGMLGTSLAAGLHGASAMRGLGGYDAADHARWLDSNGPSAGGGPGSGPTGSAPRSGPTGSGGSASAGAATGSGAATSSAAAGAGASAAAGVASGGATLAAEAAVQAAQKAKQQAHRAAGMAGDAMQGT